MVGYSGWFAKSPIKHPMKALGIEEDNYTQAEMRNLGEKVISNAIYDKKLQEQARNDLRKVFQN